LFSDEEVGDEEERAGLLFSDEEVGDEEEAVVEPSSTLSTETCMYLY